MKLVQRNLLGTTLVALVAAACASGKTSSPKHADVIALVRSARFDKAVNTAQEIYDRNPESLEAKRDLRDAKLAYLISRGRRMTFEERTEEGLDLFYRAQALDPGNDVVKDWINKTRIQLAEDSLTMSGTLISRDELAERQELLLKVLMYLPENEDSQRVENIRQLATSSLERVKENLAYCATRGKDCFSEGMSSLAQARYHEAWHDFTAAVLHDKTQEEAIVRLRRVGALVGEELLGQALEYESMGLFDAARMEFERVHQKDPGNEFAIEGLNRMEREVRAGRLFDEAEMAMLRGTPEMAEALLEEAEAMTLVQMHLVEGLRIDMRNASWERLYQDALALESEGSLIEAVKVFEELLEAAEEYKEAGLRKGYLEEFIGKAAALYEQAGAAESEADEYAFLREIQIFWPGYRDVAGRVKALDSRMHAESSGKLPMGHGAIPERGN